MSVTNLLCIVMCHAEYNKIFIELYSQKIFTNETRSFQWIVTDYMEVCLSWNTVSVTECVTAVKSWSRLLPMYVICTLYVHVYYMHRRHNCYDTVEVTAVLVLCVWSFDVNVVFSGKHQCIVNLSTNPQTACFGSSEVSSDDARVSAALNALHHCRIMTTRTNM